MKFRNLSRFIAAHVKTNYSNKFVINNFNFGIGLAFGTLYYYYEGYTIFKLTTNYFKEEITITIYNRSGISTILQLFTNHFMFAAYKPFIKLDYYQDNCDHCDNRLYHKTCKLEYSGDISRDMLKLKELLKLKI